MKRKHNQRYAKYVLLIGFIVSVIWITGIINLGISTDPKSDSTYVIESNNELKKNSESIQKTKQLTNADNAILYSKKQIEFNKEYQSDIWSLLSMFHEDSTKEQILAYNISKLKEGTEGNIEEIEYSKEDLKSVTTEYERSSIRSWIEYLQEIVDYDKQKIIDLENNGISDLEEYKQNELEKANNNAKFNLKDYSMINFLKYLYSRNG